jgi:beta-lactam-binding protein with PASTA domain
MVYLRYSIAVGIVATVLPVAQAQTAPAAKAAVVQGETSGGTPPKNTAAKAKFGAAAALAQAQPAPQPNPTETFRNKIPPSALSQVPKSELDKVTQVPVPNFGGKTLLEVQKEAVIGGKPLFVKIDPEGPANGVVIENGQTPKPGTMVVPGETRLSLNLRLPPPPAAEKTETTAVPPVKGLGAKEADLRVRGARLLPNFSGAQEDGVAGDPSPPAWTPVDVGTKVTVEFALPPVLVPRLQGRTREEAKQLLEDNHLKLGEVNGADSNDATVATQSPEPMTQVVRDTPVAVTMAVPIPPVLVPDVTKRSCEEARELIEEAGLRTAWKECPPVRVLVERQIPEAQTSVDRQSMVSVFYASVEVPPLLGLTSDEAARRLNIVGLKGAFSTSKDWFSVKSFVESQFPQGGVLVDVGSDVSVVLKVPGWQGVPIWVWAAIGLGGLWLLKHFFSRPQIPSSDTPALNPVLPPPTMTLEPHAAVGRISPGDEGGPKVRLAITLRDQAGASRITVPEEPSVTKLEVR